jgi:predicted permease
MIDIIVNVISPIFIIIGIAILIGRLFKPDVRTLSTLLIYVFLPSLSFRGISQVALDGDIAGMAIVTVIVQVAMIILGVLATRLFRYPQTTGNALVLTVMLINAANYGIPFNTFAFGEEGGRLAIVFWVVTSVVGNTLGVFFASRGSTSARKAVLNTFKVPILYATLIGLAVNVTGFTVPLPLERAISLMADASIPCMIALLGLRLATAKLSGRWGPIAVSTVLRLVVSPLIAVLAASLLGLTGTAFNVTVIQAAMPTAVVASAFALEFGSDAEFTSATTLVTTLMSIVTLTVILTALGGPTV